MPKARPEDSIHANPRSIKGRALQTPIPNTTDCLHGRVQNQQSIFPLDSQVVQRIKKEISFSYRAKPLAQLLKPTMYSKRPRASISYFILSREAVAF